MEQALCLGGSVGKAGSIDTTHPGDGVSVEFSGEGREGKIRRAKKRERAMEGCLVLVEC